MKKCRSHAQCHCVKISIMIHVVEMKGRVKLKVKRTKKDQG